MSSPEENCQINAKIGMILHSSLQKNEQKRTTAPNTTPSKFYCAPCSYSLALSAQVESEDLKSQDTRKYVKTQTLS